MTDASRGFAGGAALELMARTGRELGLWPCRLGIEMRGDSGREMGPRPAPGGRGGRGGRCPCLGGRARGPSVLSGAASVSWGRAVLTGRLAGANRNTKS